ncbi:hypothetical protein T11_13455 [Trichinella zimbabwensis]|uniref:Uncharacterized protein n=1 Tax=Trichinella zimbabwensis TaxID=268475 RepID=A0A0V1I2X8_9BILA|nr:hypothetical protein T11_13455 [Trichinella zimbabwensis]
MESSGFTKEWSTEPKTIITGQPPDENATEKETTTSELRRHDMRFITPFYKTKQSSEKPGIDSELKRETTMQTNYDQMDRPADYKVEKQAEYYKLRMIDPKAEPPKTSVTSSQTLPAEFLRKKKTTDFPSSHSKRSFVKLNPLERPQRQRLRSLEVRPITPHDYLSESLERHRAMSLSPLRSKLKINEKCVNEAWEKLPRPEKRGSPLDYKFQRVYHPTIPKFYSCEQLVLSPDVYSEYNAYCSQYGSNATLPLCSEVPQFEPSKSRVESNLLRNNYCGSQSEIDRQQRKKLPHEVLTDLVGRHRSFYKLDGYQSSDVNRNRSQEADIANSYSTMQSTLHGSAGFSEPISVNNYPCYSSGHVLGSAMPWRRRDVVTSSRIDSPLLYKNYRQPLPSLCEEKVWRCSSAVPFSEKGDVFDQVRHETKDFGHILSDSRYAQLPLKSTNNCLSKRGYLRHGSETYFDNKILDKSQAGETSGASTCTELDENLLEQTGSDAKRFWYIKPFHRAHSDKCDNDQLHLVHTDDGRYGKTCTVDAAIQCDPVKLVNRALQTPNLDEFFSSSCCTANENQPVDDEQQHNQHQRLPLFSNEQKISKEEAALFLNNGRKDDSSNLNENTNAQWQRISAQSEQPDDLISENIAFGKDNCSNDLNTRMESLREQSLSVSELFRRRKPWKPPVEEPYKFPQPREQFKCYDIVDDKEYFWKPEIVEPVFKRETKNFTPPPSPHDQLQCTRKSSKLGSSRICSDRPPLKCFQNNFLNLNERKSFLETRLSTLSLAEENMHANRNSKASEINLSQLHGNEKLTTCDLMKSPRFAFGMKDYLNDRFNRRCITPISIVTSRNLQHNVQQKSYITRTESRSLPKPRQHQEAQDLSEMAQIREKLLERARNRSTVNVNEVSKVEAELLPIPPLLTKSQSQVNLSSWEFKNSFSPRSIVSVNGHMQNPGLLRIRTDLSPALPKSLPRSNVSVQTVDQTNTSQMLPLQAVLVPIDASALTREWTREYRTTHETDGKLSSGDTEETESRHSTLIKIKDEKAKKPKSIMKQQQKRQETRKHESKWEKEAENEQNRVIKESPQVTETIEKIEETMTTEEIERRVRGRSRKEKRDRHRRKGEHSHHREIDKYGNSINWHSRHGVADDPPWTVPFGMSPDSPWRNRPMISGTTEQRYYSSQPQVKESYHREVKSKRVNDTSLNGSNYYNAPDSRRDHFWDGDYRRNDSHFHKSHSSRNVFHNEFADSFDNPYPIVEFPPTLPREDYDSREHHVPKTRSLSDWREDSRASDMSRFRRYKITCFFYLWDNEMSGLEREFHQSLLMPVSPGQNLRECQYTEQAIPGGHESFRREVTSHSGIRPRSHRNDGQSTHFSESKQEVHYKKEHTADHF